jgi:hypothetical protein
MSWTIKWTVPSFWHWDYTIFIPLSLHWISALPGMWFKKNRVKICIMIKTASQDKWNIRSIDLKIKFCNSSTGEILWSTNAINIRLCSLVVRVPGHRSGFDSQRYQIFWEVVCLERGQLSLVSTIQELLGRSSFSSLESRKYGHKDPSRWPRDTLYPQELALTSPTNGGPSV